MVFIALPGNVAITVLLTQYFHLSAAQFGLIVSLQSAWSVLQLAFVPWLNLHFTEKQLSIWAGWIHWAVFLGLAGSLFYLPHDQTGLTFPVLFGFFLALAAMQAVMGIVWTSWVQEFTPARIRGKYFGRRNAVFQTGTVLFLLAMGPWIEACRQGGDTTLRNGLAALIIFAMVVRMGSLRMQQLTFSPKDLQADSNSARPPATVSWKKQISLILGQKNLLTYFLFSACFGFCSNLLGPFFNVFMLDALRMSVSQVTSVVVLSSVTGALSMMGWGRLIDRYGNRPVMCCCLILWMTNGYLWSVTTPDRLWVLFMAWGIAGVVAAGFMQGLFGLLLKIIPEEAKTVAISINAAVTSLPAAVAPVIAGAALDACFDQGWDKLTVFQWASALHHTLVLATVLILLRVREPKSQKISCLVGIMLSYREIVSLLGLSFLTKYLFFRKARAASPEHTLPSPQKSQN
jgi:MFS family permease